MKDDILIFDQIFDNISCTIYKKNNNLKKPLLLFFHGLAGGRKTSSMGRLEELAEVGYYVISMDLYLHGDRALEPFKSSDYKYKTSEIVNVVSESAKDAYKLLNKYFIYNEEIIPNNISLFGVSAGGMCAFKLATMSNLIKNVVTMVSSPSYVNTYIDMQKHFGFESDEKFIRNIEFNIKEDPLNNMHLLKDKNILMLVGNKDEVVPKTWAEKLYHDLNRENIELKAFDVMHSSNEEMNNAMFDFFKKKFNDFSDNKVIDEYLDVTKIKDIKIIGFPFFDNDKAFYRLPKNRIEEIKLENPNILELGSNSAGGQIAFITNSKSLKIKVKLGTEFYMSHMAFTGQIGFDLYIDNNYFKTSTMDILKKEYEYLFFDNLDDSDKLIVLNFPLYSEVKYLGIKLDENAVIKYPNEYLNSGKIIIYGTSITQGGCASRPGMAVSNYLSRKLNYEIYNYGFSGNGKGERIMSEIISEIKDIDLFILDYEANANHENRLEETLFDFIDIINKKNPNIPILLVSQIKFSAYNFFEEERNSYNKRNKFQIDLVNKYNKMKNKEILYFVDGSNLLGEDYIECTVDGIHLTDLGFYRFSNNLIDTIKNLVKKGKRL